jgi:hypothetical protein
MRREFLPPLICVRPTPETAHHIGLLFDDLSTSLALGADDFYHAQALVSELLHVAAPLIGVTTPSTSPTTSTLAAPAPRKRKFAPLRGEALAAAVSLLDHNVLALGSGNSAWKSVTLSLESGSGLRQSPQ